MEGKHFDELIRRLGTGAARRRVLGGLVGTTAALLTGAAALEAKRGGNGKGKAKGKGKGKAKGKGKGKGKGQQKITICHFNGTGYETLTLGAPGARNHLKNHEEDTPFVDCCPGDECPPATAECFTASCVEGECTTTPDPLGTECSTDTVLDGECDGAGNCV